MATTFLEQLVSDEQKAKTEAEGAVVAFARAAAADKPVDQQKLLAALKATGRTVVDFAGMVQGLGHRLTLAAVVRELPKLAAEHAAILEETETNKAKDDAEDKIRAARDRDLGRRFTLIVDRLTVAQDAKIDRIRTCRNPELLEIRQSTGDRLRELAAEPKRLEEQIVRDRSAATNEPGAGMMFGEGVVELARSRTEANRARLVECRKEYDRAVLDLEAVELKMALSTD